MTDCLLDMIPRELFQTIASKSPPLLLRTLQNAKLTTTDASQRYAFNFLRSRYSQCPSYALNIDYLLICEVLDFSADALVSENVASTCQTLAQLCKELRIEEMVVLARLNDSQSK